MEIDKKHIVGKVWVNLCRFLLGALFIFSGFVKAVDPLGFFYKIQDYLTAFDMISWFPSYAPLLVGIALSAIEFSVGVFLFLGIRPEGGICIGVVADGCNDSANTLSGFGESGIRLRMLR